MSFELTFTKTMIIIFIGGSAASNDTNDKVNDDFTDQLTEVIHNVGNLQEIVMLGYVNNRLGRKRKNCISGYNAKTLK